MFELRNPIAIGASHKTRLAVALLLSVLFHAAILGGEVLVRPRAPVRAAAHPIQATLVAPVPQPAALIAPEAPRPVSRARDVPKPARRDGPGRFTAVDAAKLAQQQIARQLLYPREAIARGFEGEATVRLFFDDSGAAIAARLESSSGHSILDEAAVAAAAKVRVPTGAPAEVLVPVRFRLR
ncbi:MAG TPA: TonB family protein [Rhodocyclaceae bacterium]